MDDEEDISKEGTPDSGDDGYPKTDGYPSADNSQNLPDASEDTDLPLEEVDGIQEALEGAAEDTEDDEPQTPASDGEEPEPPGPEESPDTDDSVQPEEEDYSADVEPFDGEDESAESSVEESSTESSGPEPATSHEELASITKDLGGDFGEKVQAFQESGGAGSGDYGSDFGGDYEDSQSGGGGVSDCADANERHGQQQDDMLTEHVRRLDDMTKKLELERL